MKRSPLTRAKDLALEKALLLLLRGKVERYGELRTLSVNTAERRLMAELRLRGDPIPLVITQARYRLDSRDESCVLTFFDLRTSKEWLQNLLEDRFKEFSLTLPPYVGRLL